MTSENFKPTRLYIKRLNGIYYFGKTTSKNIEKYPGSGTVWKKKIKKYGKDQIEHLWHSDWYHSIDEIREIALHFSRENDIVNSEKWANQMEEDGVGMVHNKTINQKIQNAQKLVHASRPKEVQEEIWKRQTESRKITEKNKDPIAKKNDYAARGEKLSNTLKTKDKNYFQQKVNLMHQRLANMSQEEKDEVNRKRSIATKGVPKPQKRSKCDHCGKEGSQNYITRYHNDNCELVLSPEKLEQRNLENAILYEKLRIAATGKGKPHELLTCPHCGKTGGKGGIKRWHLDNCKHKP